MHWPQVAEYRDEMICNLDDSGQVKGYQDQGVTVVKGEARIAGPGRVDVDGRTLEADRIIVATGSDASIPPIEGLAAAGYWTNREATTLKTLPASIVILGGGPVGVELAQFFCRFGVKVTLVQSAERLVHREDQPSGRSSSTSCARKASTSGSTHEPSEFDSSAANAS